MNTKTLPHSINLINHQKEATTVSYVSNTEQENKHQSTIFPKSSPVNKVKDGRPSS